MTNTVLSSSVVIVTLLLLRLVFAKRMSRRLLYALWLLPALGLLILPFFPPDEFDDDWGIWTLVFKTAFLGIEGFFKAVFRLFHIPISVSGSLSYRACSHVHFILYKLRLDSCWIEGKIWRGGAALFLFYHTAMAIRLKVCLARHSRRIKDDSFPHLKLFGTDRVCSPVLSGFSIFLPGGTTEDTASYRYAVAHERMHIKQGDPLWNILRVLLISIYWFHPLVWVAVYLSKKDSEFSCDENVTKHLSMEEKMEYGKVILEFATGEQFKSDPSGSPPGQPSWQACNVRGHKFKKPETLRKSNLAGGETGKRIRRILGVEKGTRRHGRLYAILIAGVLLVELLLPLYARRQWEEHRENSGVVMIEFKESLWEIPPDSV